MCIDTTPLRLQLAEARVLVDHSAELEVPPIYREDRTDKLFVKDQHGGFVCTSLNNLLSALEICGVVLPEDREDRDALMQRYKTLIIQKNTVALATSVAGCKAGPLKTPGGTHILITQSATTVEPERGDCATLMALFGCLLGENSVQLETFLIFLKLWLQDYRKSLEVGPWEANLRQGQALMLVGERNSGKSLLFEVIRDLFGSQVVNPYPYFAGDTPFNGDHVTASMLLMDDSTESLHPGARQKLTQQVKQRVAVSDYRIHPKGVQAFTIRCCQRVVMLGNEDQIDASPYVTESVKDKAHVVRARPSELVRRPMSEEEAQAWVAKMKSELPAFAYHLLHEVEIPDSLQDRRFGVLAFHDEELLARLEGTEEFTVFMQVLEYTLATMATGDASLNARVQCTPRSILQRGPIRHPNPVFEYSYEGLSRELYSMMQRTVSSAVLSSLVRHTNQMGKLLEGASYLYPNRVTRGKLIGGNRKWGIQFALSQSDLESHAQLYKRCY